MNEASQRELTAPVNMSYINAPKDHLENLECQSVRSRKENRPIHGFAMATASQDLRGHVFNRSTECICLSSFVDRFFAESKISELHVTLSVQENVLRFQICRKEKRGREMLVIPLHSPLNEKEDQKQRSNETNL